MIAIRIDCRPDVVVCNAVLYSGVGKRCSGYRRRIHLCRIESGCSASKDIVTCHWRRLRGAGAVQKVVGNALDGANCADLGERPVDRYGRFDDGRARGEIQCHVRRQHQIRVVHGAVAIQIARIAGGPCKHDLMRRELSAEKQNDDELFHFALTASLTCRVNSAPTF